METVLWSGEVAPPPKVTGGGVDSCRLIEYRVGFSFTITTTWEKRTINRLSQRCISFQMNFIEL